MRKKKCSFFFSSFFFPLRIDKLQKFQKRFFRSDGIESRKCLTKNVYWLRNFFDSIINNNNNSDVYSDVKNEWGDLLRWFRCYTIITSDSFYLFCKHGKNSPFLHRCVKTEFLFFSIPYRFLYVSNYNVQILQIDLRSTHSTGNSFVLQISLPPPFHQTRFICFYCEIAY